MSLALLLTSALAPIGQGPCDIYAAGGTPCVAAHSTTRALLADYAGPLYQVMRRSDGKTRDIGSIAAEGGGRYADAAAQDAFCARTICVIAIVYDQSGKRNDLVQAIPGTFKGPRRAGFEAQPIAHMAPITIMGHKAYGVYIMPGMGLRNNDARDLAINDEPEGIYFVVDGTHYDSGCCFDYGNASTNGRAVGTGTMETTYFGTSTNWGRGDGRGPWIMADMEAGLFSGYDAKRNPMPPIRDWRFVTAIMNGGGGNHWDLRGGNAQQGGLTTYYSGPRPGSRDGGKDYFPMHKQGGVLLGIGGDNGSGSSGTFYEGVMTRGYPTEATLNAVQANIVAARYARAWIALTQLKSFTPGASQEVTATFNNASVQPIADVRLGLALPAGWSATGPDGSGGSIVLPGPVAPDASVSATFRVTASAYPEAETIIGRAEWRAVEGQLRETTEMAVRNVLPVKINEVRFSAGGDASDQFIELYNPTENAIDMSGWSVVHTPMLGDAIDIARLPAGTSLAGKRHYLLGLAGSGLSAPISAGSGIVNVRSVAGMTTGATIDVDGERRTIRKVGTAAIEPTMVFIPVSTLPWHDIPAGATSVPVANATGFAVGDRIAIGTGADMDVATVTRIGKAGTQTILADAARAGAPGIWLAAASDLTVGDTLAIGTGARKEQVRVARIGTTSGDRTEIGLTGPLRFDHQAHVDVWGLGTGIGFAPATRRPHHSGEAVQALGSGIMLDRPLRARHAAGAPVATSAAAGYRGDHAPDRWFGGALSTRGGSIALLDAGGKLVVDALVYGSKQSDSSANGTITSPELAILEGDQGGGGCIAIVPAAPGSFGPLAPPTGPSNRSLGRFPDGADSDSNCTDFAAQPYSTLPNGAAAGSKALKVPTVTDFVPGQTIKVGSAGDAETAVIATVGNAGATVSTAAVKAGETLIPVSSVTGFAAGETIEIGSGVSEESGTVAAANGGRNGARITLQAPLRRAHPVGSSLTGAGLTLVAPLTKAHADGSAVSGDAPTPGAPNLYSRN